MKTKISAAKSFILIATLTVGTSTIGLNGCADYADVRVGTPYTAAYYVPDYGPYYGEYIYDGLPWWGPDVAYVKNKIVVRDRDRGGDFGHSRWYGGHHFAPAWRGGGVARTAFSGGGVRRRMR
ncbi:MAG: hypothetical protein QOH24_1905 [Verrucomicrobiota bacterium]|jgi:hypothetical protein